MNNESKATFGGQGYKMKRWQENLLAMGITIFFMLISGLVGYEQNAMQNITFYFVMKIWLKEFSQK